MSLESLVSSYKVYITIGGLACMLAILVLLIIQTIRINRLNKKYRAFMSGKDGNSLEDMILARFHEIDEINNQLGMNTKNIEILTETLLTTYQKVGIVKYDAFEEMGGKLSFAVALLDDNNTGFILTSMHSSREGCYTYLKEIIRGESFVVLSEEEKQALNIAINRKNYME